MTIAAATTAIRRFDCNLTALRPFDDLRQNCFFFQQSSIGQRTAWAHLYFFWCQISSGSRISKNY